MSIETGTGTLNLGHPSARPAAQVPACNERLCYLRAPSCLRNRTAHTSPRYHSLQNACLAAPCPQSNNPATPGRIQVIERTRHAQRSRAVRLSNQKQQQRRRRRARAARKRLSPGARQHQQK